MRVLFFSAKFKKKILQYFKDSCSSYEQKSNYAFVRNIPFLCVILTQPEYINICLVKFPSASFSADPFNGLLIVPYVQTDKRRMPLRLKIVSPHQYCDVRLIEKHTEAS
jgi:hypothetical protein